MILWIDFQFPAPHRSSPCKKSFLSAVVQRIPRFGLEDLAFFVLLLVGVDRLDFFAVAGVS